MRLAAVLLPLAMSLPAMADPTSDSDKRLDSPSRTVAPTEGACSYTTSMFARRVLDEGEGWTFSGHLKAVDEPLPTHVAAPYAVGPNADVRVVATEMLDRITDAGWTGARLTLQGKRLVVEDTEYFVLTDISEAEVSR